MREPHRERRVGGAHGRRHVSPDTPQTPSPLSLALQAQWTLLQQQLQLGHIPATAEGDLLRLLESLPEHRAAILSDVAGVLPYLLAFAVAPIPTERTQFVALEALHATIGALVTVWGRKAAAVLVYDFLILEHSALHALGVALHVALEDHNERGGQTPDSPVVGSVLELLLMMFQLSPPAAAAALEAPDLLRSVIRAVPDASPVQVCDAAAILHALGAVPASAPVLLTHGALAAAVAYIRRGAHDAPDATVTALDLFLRLAQRLAGAPGALDPFRPDATGAAWVFEALLFSQWAAVMAHAAGWLAALLEAHPAERLAAALLQRTRAAERLAAMLHAPPPERETRNAESDAGATAARCWRALSVSSPGAAAACLLASEKALPALMHALANAPRGGGDPTRTALLRADVAGTLGVSWGFAVGESRAALRRLVLRCLSPTAQAAMGRRVRALLAHAPDAAFAAYPVALLERPAISATSGTDTEEEEEKEEEEAKRREMGQGDDVVGERDGKEGSLSRRAAQWRRFLRRTLTRLFGGDARGNGVNISTTTAATATTGGGIGAAWNAAMAPSAVTASAALLARRMPIALDAASQRLHGVGEAMPSGSIYEVVQRAEQMGGAFYLDSIQTILRLAHHYTHSFRASKQDRRRGGGGGEGRKQSFAVRSHSRRWMAPNPYRPPVPVDSSRRWSVEDLQRSDALLFHVSYDNIVPELAEAITAIETHTRHIGNCLRLCPTRDVRRRCLLNDLYMHVYPKLHMFLKFIQHHMAHSKPALQVIADGGRAVHSGNILQLYEAIGHCVGDSVTSLDTSIESRPSGVEGRHPTTSARR